MKTCDKTALRREILQGDGRDLFGGWGKAALEVEKLTFQRIEWQPKRPWMWRATRALISCCYTTLGDASSPDEISNNLKNINDLKFYHAIRGNLELAAGLRYATQCLNLPT